MARGRMYYEQRMRARNVSKHTLRPMPEPTLADSLATVYHQRWVVGKAREILQFNVLAKDAAHAVMLGEMILSHEGIEPPFFIDVNMACYEASVETKGECLRREPQAVFDDRQRRFEDGLRRRGEPGGAQIRETQAVTTRHTAANLEPDE